MNMRPLATVWWHGSVLLPGLARCSVLALIGIGLLFPALPLRAQEVGSDDTGTETNEVLDVEEASSTSATPPLTPIRSYGIDYDVNDYDYQPDFAFVPPALRDRGPYLEYEAVVILDHYDPDVAISLDLSPVGGAADTEVPREGPDEYYFVQFPIDPSINGPVTLTYTESDSKGHVDVKTESLVVDNIPPAASITGAAGPSGSVLLSGSLDGTGTDPQVLQIKEQLLDADGITPLAATTTIEAGDHGAAAVRALRGGNFSNVPLALQGNAEVLARASYARIAFTVYDQAGAHITVTVVVPLTVVPPPVEATTTPPCADSCGSNILFLPGIEGSRLYDADGHKLWEPVSGLGDIFSGDAHVHDLFLDSSGESTRPIHAKEGDLLDTVGGGDIYGSFLRTLDAWKADGTINDWKAGAYDWRLSLGDVVDKGAEDAEGNISYATATSTPYLEQTLRALAATSKTGKVTIIAHSNGGLVAKALMEKLGADAGNLVDNVVLVAVPQSGAPQALGSLLFGQDFSVRLLGVFSFSYVSKGAARDFARNSPMAYHLLPSQTYFDSVVDPDRSLVLFNADHLYAEEKAAYGSFVDAWQELSSFVTNNENGKLQSLFSTSPIGINSSLLSYASREHDALDSWAPPAGVSVYQIAGWGDDTVAGVEFYEAPVPDVIGISEYAPMYRPIFTEDGDGTVPVPSALLMSDAPNVKRYWVNLGLISFGSNSHPNHGNILAVSQLQTFIRNILLNTPALTDFISSATPPVKIPNKQLHFILHSPLSLDLYDDDGNHTGLNPDGSLSEEVPGATYGEFGEVKYISAPAGSEYRVSLTGEASGTFSLDVQEAGESTTTTTTVTGVPTTASTLASLEVSSDGEPSPLMVDEDGNGSTDFSVTLEDGGTVVYHPSSQGGSTDDTASSTDSNDHGSTAKETSHGSSSHSSGSTNTTQSWNTSVVSTPIVQAPVQKPNTIAVAPSVLPESLVSTSTPLSPILGQTASAYNAVSQQPWLTAVMNSIYSFFHALGARLAHLITIL